MDAPNFDHVVIFHPKAGATVAVKVVSLSGITTLHGDNRTQYRGVLFGQVIQTLPGGVPTYTLSLYNHPRKQPGDLVASGVTTALAAYFDLGEQNDSGVTGRAWVDAYLADALHFQVIPTFAVDSDVHADGAEITEWPGWTPEWGLARIHAEAMSELLSVHLPAAVPNLMGGKGAAGFIPEAENISLPGLEKVAGTGLLRSAQAALVKMKVATQLEHTDEWAAIRDAAEARFETIMEKLTALSIAEKEAAETQGEAFGGGVEVGTFRRR